MRRRRRNQLHVRQHAWGEPDLQHQLSPSPITHACCAARLPLSQLCIETAGRRDDQALSYAPTLSKRSTSLSRGRVVTTPWCQCPRRSMTTLPPHCRYRDLPQKCDLLAECRSFCTDRYTSRDCVTAFRIREKTKHACCRCERWQLHYLAR